MNAYLILIPFLAVCLVNHGNFVQIVQGTSLQDNSVKLIPFENNNLGIKTQYPENWTKHESSDSIRFLSPQQNALDNHTEQLKISSYVPGSVPFFQSKNTSLRLLVNNTISYLSQTKEGFELLNSQPVTANGKSGHMLEYMYASAAGPTKSLALFIPYNGKVYFVSYFADPVKYPTLLPVILNIINSTEVGIFNTEIDGDSESKSSDNGNRGNSNDGDDNGNGKDIKDDKGKDSKDDQGPIDEEIIE